MLQELSKVNKFCVIYIENILNIINKHDATITLLLWFNGHMRMQWISSVPFTLLSTGSVAAFILWTT